MKKLFYVLMTMIAALFVSGCSNKSEAQNNLDVSSLPIENVTASYVIDMNDPKIVAGFADYLFVGRVDELVNTEYLPLYGSLNSSDDYLFPYTNYKVTVLENIKGSLKQDIQVPINKFGGVNEDKTAVVLNEDDYLPQQGDICMFAVKVREDGVFVSNAKNTSNLIIRESASTYSNEDTETYKDSEVYQAYVNGANEEVDVWGEHSISEEYDAGYE